MVLDTFQYYLSIADDQILIVQEYDDLSFSPKILLTEYKNCELEVKNIITMYLCFGGQLKDLMMEVASTI